MYCFNFIRPICSIYGGWSWSFFGRFILLSNANVCFFATHGLQAVIISIFSHHILKKHPVISSGIGVTLCAVIMVIGYSLGRAFIYSTPEYAILKLPYQILQAVVGTVLGMILCWKCGIHKLYNKGTIKKE